MKAGDLVFVRSRGLIPRIIRLFDKGKFNHVAIALSETEILEANWYTRVHIISISIHDDYVVVPLNLGEKHNMEVFTSRFLGLRYDFKEIVSIWVRKLFGFKYLGKFNTPKEVICSELAAYYLEDRGIAEPGIELLAPNELYAYIKNKGY